MRSRLLDRLLVAAQVHAVEPLGPRLRLVTLTGPDLAGLDWLPGQHVRLQLAPGPAALDWLVGTLRTYTVWSYQDQTMELVVFDHWDGPGAEWARTTRPGEELMLMKPQGTFVTAPAPYHLFVGEETAQAAYGPMLRALPADARVFGRFEIDSPDERLNLIDSHHEGLGQRRAGTWSGATAGAGPRLPPRRWSRPCAGWSCPPSPAAPTWPGKPGRSS